MIKGPKTTECPASILQDHPDVTVILDEEAAAKIKQGIILLYQIYLCNNMFTEVFKNGYY